LDRTFATEILSARRRSGFQWLHSWQGKLASEEHISGASKIPQRQSLYAHKANRDNNETAACDFKTNN
jgi:hypothetical protein